MLGELEAVSRFNVGICVVEVSRSNPRSMKKGLPAKISD